MNNDVWLVVLGALLAIGSGAANSEFSAWRQQNRERKNLRIAVYDDLDEIAIIINNMNEVWEKTKELIPTYLYELESCVETYKNNRKDLYLIKGSGLRSEIISFCRDLKGTIDTNIKRVGSLSDSDETKAEQKEIEEKFVALGARANELKNKLGVLA